MKSSANVEGSNFTHNKANDSEGVALVSEHSIIEVNGCLFNNNSARLKAGVVTVESFSLAIINGSLFNSNRATNYGGAVHIIDYSTAMVDMSSFDDNHADDGAAINMFKTGNLTVYRCSFIGNIARLFGGVISSKYDSIVTIMNSNFSNNQALDNGAVVYSEDNTKTTIQNCSFTRNRGGYGGVLSAKRNCEISVTESRFEYNHANSDGGCVYARTKCSIIIADSLFAKNKAKNNGIVLASDGSSVFIEEGTLFENVVGHDGAVVYILDRSSLVINNSTFISNKANNSGGIVYARRYSNITIENSKVHKNMAENSGGVVCGQDNSYISIEKSNFTKNRADYGGIVRMYISSTVIVSSCNFSMNTVAISGGVIAAYKYCNVTIQTSSFTFNTATYGGILIAYPNTKVTFINNRCVGNTAKSGGVIRMLRESEVHVIGSNFSNNTADLGGVLCIQQGNVAVERSWLEHNSARLQGGVVYADYNSTIRAEMSVFFNNTAEGNGGAISLLDSISTTITSCTFTSNRAVGDGGTISEQTSSISIYNSTFLTSKAGRNGGVIKAVNSTVDITGSAFTDSNLGINGGVVFAHSKSFVNLLNNRFSNNLANISGGVLYLGEVSRGVIIDSVFQKNMAEVKGGAITVLGASIVNIAGSDFISNRAVKGAGLACVGRSSISFQSVSTSRKKVSTFFYNKAKYGGGIYLLESNIYFIVNTIIKSNRADRRGGGIHALNSSLFIGSSVIISNNSATQGGGVSLANTRIYNMYSEDIAFYNNIIFLNNRAILGQGGALFVDDSAKHSMTCSSDPLSRPYSDASGCFFHNVTKGLRFSFSWNFATLGGNNLYGGLLDRCTVVRFVNESKLEQNAISRFKQLSNVRYFDSKIVTSLPVQVCPCKNSKPNCREKTIPVFVKQGNTFTIQVAAVDQVNNIVPATIQSTPYNGSTLNQNETVRRLGSNCSSLDYQVIFPRVSKNYTLTIYAEGPCCGEGISNLLLQINVVACSCKAGFMQEESTTKCSCICDKSDEIFSKYVKECNSTLNSVTRKGEFWITYLNNSDDNSSSPYFIYPYCPLGYCESPSKKILINLNQPNGSDAQCANNRRGILCGSCKPNYSLSLGSSNCIKCPENWRTLLAAIIVASLFAGILLVFLLLVLNLTVAVGTMNSIIFYVNIIYANRSIFFNHWQLDLTFVPVFVSWLNMDIGFDVCFYNGMDAYVKTWLKLAFPMYIFFLVLLIIWFTSYSSKLSNLLGRRNPVATLATLILLSYTNLLEIIIRSFSPLKLNYPNGTTTINWSPDASFKYRDWKIILLTCVAIVILILGLLYTILIFSWQWLIRCSRSKFFRWTGNQKLHTFIDTYHTPYTAKHRYWTGLLLLVRVVVYLISSFTLSLNPRITLLATAVIMCSLLLYKNILMIRVYKNRMLNAMESFALFNIANFVLYTWYNFDKPSITDKELFQMVAAYVSVGTMFLLFLLIVLFHLYRYGNRKIYTLFQSTKIAMKLNDQLSRNQTHDHLTLFDGNSYRLFDTMDTPRDVDDSLNLQKPLREVPTQSSVSLESCNESSHSEHPQSNEL